MNSTQLVSFRSIYVSLIILCNLKELNSFGTAGMSKVEGWRGTLQMSSFDDEFAREETEEMRVERIVSDRIASANAHYQAIYNNQDFQSSSSSFQSSFQSPSASTQYFVPDSSILPREDRILEIQRNTAEKARVERIASMRSALEKEKRLEADRAQDEIMAAERVRLEAQQRARDIDGKRLAAEKARAKDRRTASEKGRFEGNTMDNNEGKARSDSNSYKPTNKEKDDAHYQALFIEEMRFATEKAEKFIEEEEARSAEETRLIGTSPKSTRHHSLASPKRLLSRIAIEEARILEEKLLVTEILQEAKQASYIAHEDAEVTELVRLAAVQAEAERLIEGKDQELAKIAEEKRYAVEMVDVMHRRNF